MNKPTSIMLRSGRNVDPWYLRPEDLTLVDMVLPLAHLCRYSGHCPGFYSVAEHSVLVSQHAEPADRTTRLAALLHDVPEAYLGDVTRPVKQNVGAWYHTCERRITRVIAQYFGLPEPCYPEDGTPDLWDGPVLDADNAVLRSEIRQFFDPAQIDPKYLVAHNPGGHEVHVQVHWMPPPQAAAHFLSELQLLWAPQTTAQHADIMRCWQAIERIPECR